MLSYASFTPITLGKNMKHIITITALFNVLMIIIPSYAMEKELILASDEKYATFIDNDQILIHGKNSCRIEDITTQKTVKTIDNQLTDSVINLHPNKKQFALSN